MRWALKHLVPSSRSFQETIQSHGGFGPICAPAGLAEQRIAPMTPAKRATSKTLVLRATGGSPGISVLSLRFQLAF